MKLWYQSENELENNPFTHSGSLAVPLEQRLDLMTFSNHSLKWSPFHEKEKAVFLAPC